MAKTWNYWTFFDDVHSGGTQKTKYKQIFIKAPRAKAIEVFKKHFGVDPEANSCNCCGADYTIEQGKSIKSKNFDALFYNNLDVISRVGSLEEVFIINDINSPLLGRE